MIIWLALAKPANSANAPPVVTPSANSQDQDEFPRLTDNYSLSGAYLILRYLEFMIMLKQSVRLHLFMLVAFNVGLYLPMMGRGLVHDDFVHLYSVAYQPIKSGLMHVQAGPFYTPLAWLTFRLDWMLWGMSSFPMAAENLLLHILNALLIYCLAWRLWRSEIAAWWSAFGFTLLFPANTWIVMYTATRAHALVTLFYLATLIAALWYAHTTRTKFFAAVLIIIFAGLAMFAKESGVTVVAAVFIMIGYIRLSQSKERLTLHDILLFIALLILLACYFGLRMRSGAVPIMSSSDPVYNYKQSFSGAGRNILSYGWRTYGLLAIIFCAIIASKFLGALRPALGSLKRYDILLSVMPFTVTVSPFILLPGRSAAYGYLPEIGAALLLGAVTRLPYAAQNDSSKRSVVLASVPIILVVAVFTVLTIGQSLKWVRMGEASSNVLNQIVAQQPVAQPNTFFTVRYFHTERKYGFPEAFGTGSFPIAIRLLYKDTSLDGAILLSGESPPLHKKMSEVQFEYLITDDGQIVRKVAEIPVKDN